MNIFDKILYLVFFGILAIFFIKFFLVLLLVTILLLWFRTWQMKKESNQSIFLQGRVPNPKPDGFYQGDMGFSTAWIGKKFNNKDSVGINIFKDKKGKEVEKYQFKTYVGRGLFDPNLLVLKIDYNIRGNPFWMRCVLDEIIEVAPNEYLGKLHLRIIHSFPFSILFFELKLPALQDLSK